jgi:hypothetical protein
MYSTLTMFPGSMNLAGPAVGPMLEPPRNSPRVALVAAGPGQLVSGEVPPTLPTEKEGSGITPAMM